MKTDKEDEIGKWSVESLNFTMNYKGDVIEKFITQDLPKAITDEFWQLGKEAETLLKGLAE
jgi:hypothetical protein